MSDARIIDTRHLGEDHAIGAWLVDGCLVDCGPTSTLGAVLEGLGDERPQRLLLTHIHLDHAGGAGALVRRWPDLEVWVHERGAPHLAAPEKLVKSAGRLYGEDMDRLWGEVVPVPRENLRVLSGGEREGPWRVEATPGHASHHVSYLHETSATAFCGDTAGVRIPPAGPVLPPTPPPDIDVDAWRRSIDLVEAWRPDRVALTHFGAYEDVGAHLDALRAALDRVVAWATELGDADAYRARLHEDVVARADRATADRYEHVMPADQGFAGLERALRRVRSSGR